MFSQSTPLPPPRRSRQPAQSSWLKLLASKSIQAPSHTQMRRVKSTMSRSDEQSPGNTHHPTNGPADSVRFKLAIKPACDLVNLEREGGSETLPQVWETPILKASLCLTFTLGAPPQWGRPAFPGTHIPTFPPPGLPAHLGHVHLDGCVVLGTDDAVASGAVEKGSSEQKGHGG